ncbi:hypothetical protein NDU88_005928 [Pleurodeles waltl]|uniref:Uncharacterized protein n=1 Tax=Pleurodeles waltl TaxID=8319 RepID=A0AAV7UK41_PLEWA|nr:hypothetical protein NDU88_005928 [Pleurodeles waltl]
MENYEFLKNEWVFADQQDVAFRVDRDAFGCAGYERTLYQWSGDRGWHPETKTVRQIWKKASRYGGQEHSIIAMTPCTLRCRIYSAGIRKNLGMEKASQYVWDQAFPRFVCSRK